MTKEFNWREEYAKDVAASAERIALSEMAIKRGDEFVWTGTNTNDLVRPRSPLGMMRRVYRELSHLEGETAIREATVRNRKQTKEHGYAPGALATIAYEGSVGKYDDLAEWHLDNDYNTEDYYIEAVTSWLLAVYRR